MPGDAAAASAIRAHVTVVATVDDEHGLLCVAFKEAVEGLQLV